MHAMATGVKPTFEILPVRLREVHSSQATSFHPISLSSGEVRHQGCELCSHALPVVLRVSRGTTLRLSPGVSAPPALLRLFVVLGWIGITEGFQNFVWFKIDSHLACLHNLFYCRNHMLQLISPFDE